MSKPAWLLYDHGRLVASVRADSPFAAWGLFAQAKLVGDEVVQAP
jgi:hypothetical protein